MSLLLAAATLDGPPFSREATDIKSWPFSGSGDVARGEVVESLELKDNVLAEGEKVSDSCRRCAGGAGGASDFALPNILPPPSFLPDIAGGYWGVVCDFGLEASPSQGVGREGIPSVSSNFLLSPTA